MTRLKIAMIIASLAMLCGISTVLAASSTNVITLPANLKVVEEETFLGAKSIDIVVIPNGATEIGDRAFADSSVREVWVPTSLYNMSASAFDGCGNVLLVLLSNGAGDKAGTYSPIEAKFREGQYESLINVGYINVVDGGLFGGVIAGDEYVISDGITAICRAPSVDRLIIPDGVALGGNCFDGSFTEVYEVILPETMAEIGNSTFSGGTTITSINIPTMVTRIGDLAFSHCSNLKEIKLPQGLQSIGERAFIDCHAFTEVILPDSLTKIGWGAFDMCYHLESIEIPDGITDIEPKTFSGCSAMYYVHLPSGLTTIGEEAFAYCRALTSIELPSSLTSIDDTSFMKSGLQVVFAEKGSYAWEWAEQQGYIVKTPESAYGDFTYTVSDDGCAITGYTGTSDDVFIPSSIEKIPITSIDTKAFYGNSAIKSITIPNQIVQIGANAFYDCIGLEQIHFDGTLEQWLSIDFTNYASHPNYFCNSIDFNGVVPVDVEIPKEIESIPAYALCNINSITSVKLSTSTTSIGNYAFKDCSALQEVLLPDTVTSIASNAFTLSDNACICVPRDTYAYYWAVAHQYNVDTNIFEYSADINDCVITGFKLDVKNYIIPSEIDGKTVTSIKNKAFENSKMTSVQIPDSVTYIGEYAFPKSLESIHITSISAWISITKSYYSFTNDFILCIEDEPVTDIIIPEDVTIIARAAFARCSNLTGIVIPNGVTSISADSFCGCTGLQNITIPESVAAIDSYAFFGCTSLVSVKLPVSLISIGDYAFGYCSNLTDVVIPESVTEVSESAFYETPFAA